MATRQAVNNTRATTPVSVPEITRIQVEGNDTVSFLYGAAPPYQWVRGMSQIMEQNPAYISYRYDTITISQVAGESFTFTVYSITDVGGNTFVPLTTLDTSDVVAAKTQEIYRLLVTAIFKGCCECGNTEPECSIQYVSGNGEDPGTILIGSGSASINYFTANNQDFTGFWPIIQDGSWFFIFSKTDPTVYGVFQLSNYSDGGAFAQFDVTLLAGTDIFPEGTELCIDVTSVGGSLVQDWQDTLIVGSTLTQDNTVDGGNFDFIFDNNNSFVINSPGGSIETDINGSSLIAGSQSITVNGSYIDIITPNYASASTGWVLALDASGHVEYVEAGTGTISSIGLFMPPAFTVSTPNPLTSNGSFTVAGAGTVLEYIDGTGNLQTFPIYTVENGLHAFGGVPGEAPPDPYLFHLGGLLVEDTVITATNGGTEYVLGVAGTANQNTRRPLSVTNLGNGGVAVFSDFGSGSRPNPSVQMITDNDLFNPILTLSMQGDLPNPNPVFTDRTTLLRLRYDGTQAVGARMSIDYQFREDDPTPAYFIAGRLTTEMTDMTLGDEQSLFELQLYDQGSRQTKLQVTGPGQLILDEYGPAVFSDGTTNIDNSLSYVLATDNTGRVWKKLATGGGTVTSVGATGLLTTTATNPFTTSGVVTSQMNSGFLVGRYDAGLGVFQEIALGTNLSLVGNTLNATGGGPTYDSAEGVYKNTFLANDTFELGMDSPIGAFGTIPFLTDRYIDVDTYSFNISSQASNRFSFLASGQLQMLEYNNSTAFDAVSGPSVGVLNVDNTGRVFVADAGVGTTYTVDNGLIENPADNFQLGGPSVGTGLLVRDTYITNDGFPFVIDQIGSSTIGLNVRHTSSNPDSGTAIQATSSNGWAVRASINGNPATGDGNGSAYEGLSQNDYVAQFLRNDASSSGNVGLLKLTRNTSALQPFAGIAGSIDFWIEARSTLVVPPPTQPTSSIVSEWTSPGPVGRNSSLYIYGYDDTFGGQVLNAGFNGIGLVSFYQYGQVPAQFYDPSPVWALGVDASGNVVEIDVGGGPGTTYTVNNGLTENPANNFQLGGLLVQDTVVSGDVNQFDLTFDQLNEFYVNGNSKMQITSTNAIGDYSQCYVASFAAQLINVTAGFASSTISAEPGAASMEATPVKILLNSTEMQLKTPAVVALSAVNGQVLTLMDATTGEAEWQTSVGTTYTVDNGLTESPLTNFQLGGTLNTSTNIDGVLAYDLNFIDLISSANTALKSYSFATTASGNNALMSLDSLNNVSRFSHEDGATTTVSAIELTGTELRVQTPLYTTKTAGDVLTLVDPTTGEAEWEPAPLGGIPFAVATAFSATPNTYNTTITGVTGYTDGDAYIIRFNTGNESAATLNINGIGAKALHYNNAGELIGGDIWAGSEMLCVFNFLNDSFDCIGTSPNSLYAYVTNDEATSITKGQAVYAHSGAGDRMTVKLARANTDATSAQTIGIVFSTSIGANQRGIILIQGYLTGLTQFPTGTWTDGDPVYLSPTTPGAFSQTKPLAPSHLVYLGVCAKASNGSAGRMYVRIQNGYEMDELHDVASTGAVNNDILYRDTTVTPNLWKPASIATILGYTPVTSARTISTTSPLTGGGDLSANRTLSIPAATGSVDGYLTSTDWTTFNNKAPLASPAFTGTPTAPTAAAGTNDTQIATTAFVQSTISGGAAVPSYTMKANNTGASAVPTDQVFRYPGNQSFTGTISTSAGSWGAGSYYYNWHRIGNMVNYTFQFIVTTPVSITNINWDLPADMPSPIVPSGFSSNSTWLIRNFLTMVTTLSGTTQTTFSGGLRVKSTVGPTFDFYFSGTAGSYKTVTYNGTYFTS